MTVVVVVVVVVHVLGGCHAFTDVFGEQPPMVCRRSGDPDTMAASFGVLASHLEALYTISDAYRAGRMKIMIVKVTHQACMLRFHLFLL